MYFGPPAKSSPISYLYWGEPFSRILGTQLIKKNRPVGSIGKVVRPKGEYFVSGVSEFFLPN